jgi:leader peptidase (prepilin peptidase)/N-methyltransferase
MEWWLYAPVGLWCLFVLAIGLTVGSFLNVLIARLPLEKSIVWPSSRCFSCYKPIRLTDNLPIIGYLRLRGRCRHCGAAFSSRYLWVEIGTATATLALFVLEVLLNAHAVPALNQDLLNGHTAYPPGVFWAMFFYHCVLLWALIAAAIIDAEHRIIPPLIPYTGLFVGVVGGTIMPWPWPNPAGEIAALPTDPAWMLPEYWGKIPPGVQPWPFYGPTFDFAPPGSYTLGLLNSLLGALAGSLMVRFVKAFFELGFGREAMGLGDADLLMMAGAFLGWQIAVLSLFVGAFCALVLKLLASIIVREPASRSAAPESGVPFDARELPFGPGLAIGIVLTWFAWPWLGPSLQYVFFDWVALTLSAIVFSVGTLAAGLFLRRPDEAASATTKP